MRQVILVLINLVVIAELNSQAKILEDSILNNLESQIEKNWNVEISEDTLIIESKNFMWIYFYNIAGIPPDDPELDKYSDDHLKKNGEKTKAKIYLKLEPKWTQARIQLAKKENLKIYKEIDTLLYIYELSHLQRTFRWHEELFWETTKEEEERIDIYKAEKEKLMNKIIKIPVYQSEHYSLFIINRNWQLGGIDTAHLIPMIFPDTETTEIHTLETLINKLLKTTTNKNEHH